MGVADETQRWPEDMTCVEVGKNADAMFWARWFRVSVGMLRHVVRVVGCRYKDVLLFLLRKRAA